MMISHVLCLFLKETIQFKRAAVKEIAAIVDTAWLMARFGYTTFDL
jgi:hypothetical protein